MRQGVEEPVSSWDELDGQLPVGLFYLSNDGRAECDMPEALIHRHHHWKVRAMASRKVAEDTAQSGACSQILLAESTCKNIWKNPSLRKMSVFSILNENFYEPPLWKKKKINLDVKYQSQIMFFDTLCKIKSEYKNQHLSLTRKLIVLCFNFLWRQRMIYSGHHGILYHFPLNNVSSPLFVSNTSNAFRKVLPKAPKIFHSADASASKLGYFLLSDSLM